MRRRNLLGESKPTLTLSANSGTTALYGGTSSFQVYYNGALLTAATPTITKNQSWITTSYTKSNGTVTLTRKGNFSKSTRTATITVSYSGLSATYRLTQQHGTTLTFSPNKTVEPTKGVEYVYFYVDGYLVDYHGMDYITYQESDPYSMIGCSPQYDDDNDIHIPYCSNTGTTSRSLSYSISWGGTSVGTYTLTQKADYITATTSGSVSTTYTPVSISQVTAVYLYGEQCRGSGRLTGSTSQFAWHSGGYFGGELVTNGVFNEVINYTETQKWKSGKANTYEQKTKNVYSKQETGISLTAVSSTYNTQYMIDNRSTLSFRLNVNGGSTSLYLDFNVAQCTQQNGVWWSGDAITVSYESLSSTALYGGCVG